MNRRDATTAMLVPLLAALPGAGLFKRFRMWRPIGEGGLVEYAEDGRPIRASCRPGSPYYAPEERSVIVTVDGRKPAYAFEHDRREGWVLQDRYEHSARYMDELKNEPKNTGNYLGAFKLRGKVVATYI